MGPSDSEQRYARHYVLKDFGPEAQKKLSKARVLIVGCGGLGNPVSQYLVAAGVGRIGLVDHDLVSLSNLQRQVLFSEDDIGKLKSEVAAEKLARLNSSIEIIGIKERINRDNVESILNDYEIVVDGSDNFETRYLLNDACVLFDKTLVFAAVNQYEAQVGVANAPTNTNTRSPNFRDLFPMPPEPGTVQNCAEAGVLGVLPGMAGSIQAGEVIKVITGVGEALIGKLLIIEALTMNFQTIRYNKNPDATITRLPEFTSYCSANNLLISWEELERLMAGDKRIALIDVRESYEHKFQNAGGISIPLASIRSRLDELRQFELVACYCETGVRSDLAVRTINEEIPGLTAYSVEGGIQARLTPAVN